MPERKQRTRLAAHSFGVNITLLAFALTIAIGVAAFAPNTVTDWLLSIGPFWGAVAFAIPIFFFARFLARSAATKCPKCGEETLETEPGRKFSSRHQCRNCNAVFLNGIEQERT